MRCKILVLAHGQLAEYLVSTMEMVMGRTEGLAYINLLPDADLLQYSQMIQEIVEENKESGILIMTDILGGSPFLNSAKILGQHLNDKVELVTGVNLPMLVETASNIDMDAAELKKIAVEAGKTNIYDIRSKMK